jgi:hypothetical protein
VSLVGIFLSFLEEEKPVKTGGTKLSSSPREEERLHCRSKQHRFELFF